MNRFAQGLAATLAALALAFAPGGAAHAADGAWKLSDEVSMLDGTHRYIATLEGDVKVFGDEASGLTTPLLSLECSWNGYSLRLIWPDEIEPAEGARLADVMWKLDTGEVRHSAWSVRGKTLIMAGPTGYDWTRGLVTAGHLYVRVPDHHGGQETSFTLQGLGEIYDRIGHMNCPKV